MARYRGWEPTLYGLGGISQWRIYLCILSTLRLWTKRGNDDITKLLLTPQVGYETNSDYVRIVQEHSTPFGL